MKAKKTNSYLYGLATDTQTGPVAGICKFFLFILSFLYGVAVRCLMLIQGIKPVQLAAKVISVGNITVGGTGKTSLVEYISRFLQGKGKKVVILSRGSANRQSLADEPAMLAKNLGNIPVVVDTDRIRGASKAIKDYQAGTVILDDGFQQWKIKKDLEIVTIDATDPFGNRHVLPRGLLREPLSSLKRADILVLTKTNLNPDFEDIKDYLKEINPSSVIAEAVHMPVGFYKFGENNLLQSIDTLKDKAVVLVSGIGDPDSFENLVVSLGISVVANFCFPDHHNYTQQELDEIARDSLNKKADAILTTEKDAVRINNSCQLSVFNQLFVLKIELKIKNNEQEFHNRLLRIYSP